MAKSEAPHAKLRVSRDKLDGELDARIAAGRALQSRAIQSNADLDAAQDEYYTWDEYNRRLLKLRFTTDEVQEMYSSRGPFIGFTGTTLEYDIREFRSDVGRCVRRLESIKGQLGLYEESSAAGERETLGTKIFLVHGHDERRKAEVARLLEHITKLEVVILHEQPNLSRTIIEKFEKHAAEAAYAVVLMTADDQGGPVGGPMRPRARQNVVFEQGFFVGALGRSHVTVLYEPGVELPSDWGGVLYIELDPDGAWKMKLAREIQAVAIDVDLTKAV